MIKRSYHKRPAIIEALVLARTLDQAADVLEYNDSRALRRRMGSLGIKRRKLPDCLLIEAKR